MKGNLLTKDPPQKGQKGRSVGGGERENFSFSSPAVQKTESKTSIKSSPWGQKQKCGDKIRMRGR